MTLPFVQPLLEFEFGDLLARGPQFFSCEYVSVADPAGYGLSQPGHPRALAVNREYLLCDRNN